MDFLKQFNSSLQMLVAKLAPAVVEIHVESFGLVEDNQGERTAVIERQTKLGSGVIIDPEGFIVTNAHVVSNARTVNVVLTPMAKDTGEPGGDHVDLPSPHCGLA